MDAWKLFAFITLLLINKLHFGLSKCDRPTAASGSISNSKYAKRYFECWNLIVPSNEYVELNMTSFVSILGCSHSHVEILIANKDKYIFCPDQNSTWKKVTAFADVVVTHKINSITNILSRFSMKYRRENILCAQENTFKCNDGVCIPQFQVCDGLNQCHDGVDENGCKNSSCAQENSFKCNDGVCIPHFQICDGINNCYDGGDEKECETGVFAVPGVSDSRLYGIRWMVKMWMPTQGWQDNNHRGIISFFLATKRIGKDVGVLENLMIKQLQLQALSSLIRDKTEPISANQLSMFVNAMIVTCQDPRDFYGFDLLKLLKEKAEESAITTRSVAYLALCNAGETLQVNETSDLLKILNTDWNYTFFLEVQAVALMALTCQRNNQKDSFNSSMLQTEYDHAVENLKQLQFSDGSFGNIYTTAIVTQALLSAGQENSRDWKFNAAVHHLMRHLNLSSIDFLGVYLILPILNGRSLSDIGNIDCPVDIQNKSQGDSAPDVKNKIFSKIRVTYSLYIGDEKETIHSISLRTPENITVFDMMKLAEEADSSYKFQWMQMGQKLYIYGISGIINDFEDGLFWLLQAKEGSTLTHISTSPDKVIVHNGAHIIMWYRKIRVRKNFQ